MLSELVAFDSVNSVAATVNNVKTNSSELLNSVCENAEQAGGTIAYFDGLGERFLTWNAIGDRLCIRELSLSKDIPNSVVELNFSNARVLSCSLFHEPNELFNLTCTSDGVYQEIYSPFHQGSILSKKCPHFARFYPIKALSSSEITCTASHRNADECSLFAFGIKSGSIVIACAFDNNREHIEINELEIVSRYSKIWSGIVPAFSGKQEQEEAVCPITLGFIKDINDYTFLVCVGKDHQFRAWDLQSQKCVATLDILKALATVCDSFMVLSNSNQRSAAFAPGHRHRLKTTQSYVLIYMELVPTHSVRIPSTPMSYWVWIKLNFIENAIEFSVERIEPVRKNPSLPISLTRSNGRLIDFIPCVSFKKYSENEMDANNLEDMQQPILGVWSLVDFTLDDGSINPTLQWTSFTGASKPISPILSAGSCCPGVCSPKYWEEPLPESILHYKYHSSQILSAEESDRVDDDEMTGCMMKISNFMDYIFATGRFAKIAICNAFKSLMQNQEIPHGNLSPNAPIHDLRDEISHVIVSELQPSLSSSEFKTLLTTFHQNIVDYHRQASEQLGLFCSSSSNHDVVVVRRSGISITRRVPSNEEVLWNGDLLGGCPVESDPQIESIGNKVAQLHARNHLLIHCRHVVEQLVKSEVWRDHERRLSNDLDVFTKTFRTLSKLRSDLLSDDTHERLFDRGFNAKEDDEMVDAFLWLISVLSSPDSCAIPYKADNDEENATHGGFLGGSKLSAELLQHGVWQSTQTRLLFCVAAHLLWSHGSHEKNLRIEGHLEQVYRSLCIVRWLTVTRARSTIEEEYLSSVWTHLKLLGMANVPEEADLGFSEDLDGGGRRCRASNFGLLRSAGLTLLEELLLSRRLKVASSTSGESWCSRFTNTLATLQQALCPVESNGETMAPILQHLLVEARCKEVRTLCKCLSPEAFASIDLEGRAVQALQRQVQSSDISFSSTQSSQQWWPGDVNALYVCASLALLWSGLTDEAVEQYIGGSVHLRDNLGSRLDQLAPECPPQLAINYPNTVSPCSLTEKLFPNEFSLSRGSLGNIPGDCLAPYVADEVQIRYLIKIMPVLEQLDKPQHVIRLCECALGAIQQAAVNAFDEGLLQFKPNPHLASLLCGGSDESSPVDLQKMNLGNKTDAANCLFPVTSVNPAADAAFLGFARNLASLEAVLRTRIFRHELAVGNLTRAHALVMSNPDKARQRDCLHLLITTLCDRGQTGQLVNFEYGAMENELISTLEFRARATDVVFPAGRGKNRNHSTTAPTTTTNPFYDVLYAYYIHRLRFHSAAAICFEEVIRLAEESFVCFSEISKGGSIVGGAGSGSQALMLLQGQAYCLSAAINALELLPPEDQWLIKPDSRVRFATELLEDEEKAAAAAADNGDAISWAFHEQESEDVENDANSADPAAGDSVERPAAGRRILRLTDLEHHYVFVRARLRLAQVSWDQGMLRIGATTVHDLYASLIATALYEEAFHLLCAFNLNAEAMVSAVATRCAILMEHKQPSKSAPCLPPLAKCPSPLTVEKTLLSKSVAALADYFNFCGGKNSNFEGGCSNDLLGLYNSLLQLLLTNLPPSATGTRGKWGLDLLACRVFLTSSAVGASGSPHPIHTNASATAQLPGWLTQRLLSGQERHFERSPGPVVPLLRLLFRSHRLCEAGRLAISMLSAAVGPETGQCPAFLKETDLCQLATNLHSLPSRVHSSSVNIPHSLLVQVLDALQSASSDSHFHASIYNELQSLMEKYYSTLVSVSG